MSLHVFRTTHALWLSPVDPSGGDEKDPPSGEDGAVSDGEDLPYRVEVWDELGEHVEVVVAVSLSPAIGYAAYYAATREYPGRAITLRHRRRILSRWTAQTH